LISKFFLNSFVTFTKYYIIGDEYFVLMKHGRILTRKHGRSTD